MTPFRKLQRVSDYLKNLSSDNHTHLFVTDQAHIVKSLATASGIVVAKARPELFTDGRFSSYSISTVIFVIHPDLGSGRTEENENSMYDQMGEVATRIVADLKENIDSGCSTLRGVSCGNISMVPTASVFGGWFGWIIEITLE